jgi:branched-chain amino acid aminotransferase
MPQELAYFQGRVVPLAEANVNIRTHAFLYGTACFEGIRGNWNADDGRLYLFRVPEHYRRLQMSCRILKIGLPYSEEHLTKLTADLVAEAGFAEDVYVRPIAYKSEHTIGPRMHDIEDDFLVFVMPFGAYLDDSGIRCQTSTWRRVDDLGIPARAKVNGLYVNSALAKTEALENGFDEAIMLDERGHVSEGSGENVFLVREGKIITPPPSDNILEGITRSSVLELARVELGIETVERAIDRSELYVADECFLTGTAAHCTAVIEVDRRPVGDGTPGEVTRRLGQLYFDAIRGKNAKYAHWLTAIEPKGAAAGRTARSETVA